MLLVWIKEICGECGPLPEAVVSSGTMDTELTTSCLKTAYPLGFVVPIFVAAQRTNTLSFSAFATRTSSSTELKKSSSFIHESQELNMVTHKSGIIEAMALAILFFLIVFIPYIPFFL